jgi:hypothetical protein
MKKLFYVISSALLTIALLLPNATLEIEQLASFDDYPDIDNGGEVKISNFDDYPEIV